MTACRAPGSLRPVDQPDIVLVKALGHDLLRPGNIAERHHEDGRQGRAVCADRRSAPPARKQNRSTSDREGAGDRALSLSKAAVRSCRARSNEAPPGLRARGTRRSELPRSDRPRPGYARRLHSSLTSTSTPRSAAPSRIPASTSIRGGPAHFPALASADPDGARLVDRRRRHRLPLRADDRRARDVPRRVPVFLLARRLGLSPDRARPRGACLARSGHALRVVHHLRTVRLPAGARRDSGSDSCLAEPSRRAQLAFVALAAPGGPHESPARRTAGRLRPGDTRVGLRERRVRAALREQLLPIGIFVLTLLGLCSGRAQPHARRTTAPSFTSTCIRSRSSAGRAGTRCARVCGRLDHRPGRVARPLVRAPSPCDAARASFGVVVVLLTPCSSRRRRSCRRTPPTAPASTA